MERQFRQRAHELRRAPGPVAWDRLERQLDRRHRRRRSGYYRLAGIAAALLVLTGSVWLLTQRSYTPTDAAHLAELRAPAAPVALPAPSVAAESDYRRRARSWHTSAIDEGQRGQLLVVTAPDGRKRLPVIAPAPERTRLAPVSRLRVRPEAEWRRSL